MKLELTEEEFNNWMKYKNAYFTLEDLATEMRKIYKYEQLSDNSYEMIDRVYGLLFSIAQENDYTVFS